MIKTAGFLIRPWAFNLNAFSFKKKAGILSLFAAHRTSVCCGPNKCLLRSKQENHPSFSFKFSRLLRKRSNAFA